MIFNLPKPPSINHIYGFTSRGGFARSYITKIGKTWFTQAELLINQQRTDKNTINTPVEVKIGLYTARVQDIDNIVKPILDALQKAEIIRNDNLIHRLVVEKHRSKIADERVEISLTNIP